LHLDVKPANIIVARGRPILCDFGIARWQTDPRPSHVTGTEDYTSPEECRLGEITPAADIFGVGVTLYELLTGHLPFPQKGEDEPQPPTLQPQSSVRQYRKEVPVGLEKLILSCLSDISIVGRRFGPRAFIPNYK
jgi:serine/threonine protein kinase